MNKVAMIILCAAVLAAGAGKAEKQQQAKENERKQLQSSLEATRDSLERLITQQYSFKQKTVEQREADKEELERQREQQERMENELARIKEERLDREQSLDDERKSLTAKQEEWAYLKGQLKDIFAKEAEGLAEAFPLDKELRRAEIERVRTGLSERTPPAAVFASYVDYRLRWFNIGDTVQLVKAAVMPEESGPKQLMIARFGNVLGYGVETDAGAPGGAACYYLRQTGRLGAERYAVERIANPQFAAKLSDVFPTWVQTGRVEGNVPLEVMQNDQARLLIAGKRQSYGAGLYETLAKGGWVMIPLLLLPFWALYLLLLKVSQYTSRGRLLKKQFSTAMRFFEKNDFAGALASAKDSKKGVMARIVQTSVERRSLGREVSERTVFDLLSLEAPPLSRNLNTMAVIASAAPLLGLLGTISGMITLFAAVTHYGTGDPKFLAGGISEALITAKTGLAIAIPTLFVHDLLRGAKDRLMADMEKNAIAVLNAVYPEE